MSQESPISCPICKLEAPDVNVIGSDDFGRKLTYKCARCGTYVITQLGKIMVEGLPANPKISAWTRDRKELGLDPPEIVSENLKKIENSIPSYSPSQKQLILLRNLERKTAFPGQKVLIVTHYDYPLAWASKKEELEFYLQSLLERGLLQKTNGLENSIDSFAFKVHITPKGWDFLDQHAKPSVMNDQVFVAMSFSPEMASAWENGIRPAIKDAGFKAFRVDVEPHIDRIDVKIVAEIKNSRFLVADVTQQKQGVYFEAGFAIGMGIPVIWSVKKDDLPNVHFDTRQYNHIVWENDDDLKEQLFDFICAVIGKMKET